MKKQNLKDLKLNKKRISNLSYKALGGIDEVETFDGLQSNFGPCQGGTKCCTITATLYCTAIAELCGQ